MLSALERARELQPLDTAKARRDAASLAAGSADRDVEMRESRLDAHGDRPGRGRAEDAPPATVTLTPFAIGRPRLRRLKGMARTHFATWMARELTYRADADPQRLVTGAQLPAPLPTSCRALRDLLAATCPTEEIDGETWLDFLTKADDVDSDEDSDEEDQDQ